MKKILTAALALAMLTACSQTAIIPGTESSAQTTAPTAETTTVLATEQATEITTAATTAQTTTAKTTAATTTPAQTTTAPKTILQPAKTTTPAATSTQATTTTQKVPVNFEHLPAAAVTKVSKAELANADGTLTKAFEKQIDTLTAYYTKLDKSRTIYPSLYDFNNDGIPEIFIISHSGAQGVMPCYVYYADDLSYMGMFDGYCRDGFTRFTDAGFLGGTIMQTYYEHSNSKREEKYTHLTLSNELLSSSTLASDSIGINFGECFPTLAAKSSADKTSKDSTAYWREDCGSAYSISAYDYAKVWNHADFSANLTALYNKCISLKHSAGIGSGSESRNFIFVGSGAFYKNSSSVYFINSSGQTQSLNVGNCSEIYRLNGSMTVFQQSGETSPCTVYDVVNGAPHKIEELSGIGQSLCYSTLYNDALQLTRTEPAQAFGETAHTDYHFYWDSKTSSFKEYGSIKLDSYEFKAIFGESAQKYIEQIESGSNLIEEGFVSGSERGEITDILYRYDRTFIINFRIPITAVSTNGTVKVLGYKYGYITLKPLIAGSTLLKEIDRGYGNYLTALNPAAAVYPAKKPTFADFR